MAVKFSNNAATTLSAGISSGVTSFTVASNSGFPTLGGSDWTYVTVDSEVVKITAISGTTFTCVATSSSHSNGDNVELRMTAELLNDFAEDLEALPKAGGTMTGDINFADGDKVQFGADADLQIYHNGANSIIQDNGTGNIRIQTTNTVEFGDQAFNETFAEFNDDGAVNLYHNNLLKLATTSTGIDVTGTVTADGLTVGSASGVFPSEAIEVRGNGGTSGYHNGFGLGSGNNQFRIFADDTNNTTGSIKFDIRNRDRILIEDSGDISFYEDTGTTPKFFWDASAESLGIGTSSPFTTLEISSTDPIIRLNDSNGVADKSNYEIRAIGASGAESIEFRTVNDANNSYNTLMSLNHGGNVGIGTASPATLLHLEASSSKLRVEETSGSYVELEAGGAAAYVNSKASHPLVFRPAGTERMRIDSSGNVGIGTASSNYPLTIKANGAVSYNGATDLDGESFLSLEGTSADGEAAMIRWANHGSMNNYFGVVQVGASGQGDFVWTSYDGSAYAERMRIDSSGNVGIGTTSPLTKMHINDTGVGVKNNIILSQLGNTTGNSTSLKFKFNSGGVSGGGILSEKLSTAGSALVFTTGAALNGADAERMRIDSSGNVLVGTTSAGGSAGVTLHSSGYIQPRTNTGIPAIYADREGSDGSIVELRKDGTAVGSIGVDNGDNLFLEGTEGGLQIGTNTIFPHKNGASSNGVIDLGASTAMWKHLYLNGTALINTAVSIAGVKLFGASGTTATNTTFYSEFPVSSSSGGQISLVEAGFSHHAMSSYGCALMGWYVTYNGNYTSGTTISNITSGNGGSFTVSTTTTGLLRVTHNAGTYGGGGHWFIKVTTKNS